MDKNWLIRTATNQILGPVTKDKVRDLIWKKMVSHEDELASGNGFWFYYREQIFVEKYITGSEDQPFDPISDFKSEQAKVASAKDVVQIAPNVKDLECPTIEGDKSDADDLPQEFQYPSGDDLDFPAAFGLAPAQTLSSVPGYSDAHIENVREGTLGGDEIFEFYLDTENKEEELNYTHDDKQKFKYPDDKDLESPVLAQVEQVDKKEFKLEDNEDVATENEAVLPSDNDLEFPEI